MVKKKLNFRWILFIFSIIFLIIIVYSWQIKTEKINLPAPSVSSCEEVLINGAPKDKINVVFVPINYTNKSLFKEHVDLDIDWNGSNYGLFSVEPFKSNKKAFNFYRIDNNPNIFGCLNKASNEACKPYDLVYNFVKKTCGDKLGNEIIYPILMAYVAVLINEDIGTAGWVDAPGVSISLMWSSRTSEDPNHRQVFVHEFGGHSFGLLQDEYRTSSPLKNAKLAPNCDVVGCPKWSGLFGVEGVGCVQGCAGHNELYHPTKCSLVTDGSGNPVRNSKDPKNRYILDCNIMDKVVGVGIILQNGSIISAKEVELYSRMHFDPVSRRAIEKRFSQFQTSTPTQPTSSTKPECTKGCGFCINAGDSCSKCDDCPKLIGCHPLTGKNCKYWDCINSKCAIIIK